MKFQTKYCDTIVHKSNFYGEQKNLVFNETELCKSVNA